MQSTPKKLSRGADNLVTPQMKMDLREELQSAINKRNILSKRSKQKCMQFLESSFDRDDDEDAMKGDEPTDADRRINLRRKAIEEILTSERSYIAQLDKLILYFVNPLKELNLIDISSHTTLFGQLELIHNINSELLQRLEADLDDCGNAFIKLAPFFKIYSVYAFDYKNSMMLLQNLTTKNLPFRQFLEKNESRPEVQTKLNSLLITPIQRVPRYRLLLQQVLLYTSPAESDFKLIQESVKQIELAIEHINACVEDQENIQKMMNIQNSLASRQPNIMKSVSRKFIKEGMLFKYASNGTMLKRYCVLFSDIFMYCKVLKDRKPETVVDNSLDCCCIFPLKKCKVNEIFAGKFKLTCIGEGIILCSEDVDTGRAWIRAIRKAVDEHIETRKTLRKDSSKRKPMRKREVKKFERFEAELMSPTEKKNNFDTKIFYGQNSSMTDISKLGSTISAGGCFKSARLFRKRKRSECGGSEENENDNTATGNESTIAQPVIAEKRSLLSVIGEKLTFTRTKTETPPRPSQPRSILSPNSSYRSFEFHLAGEQNHSYQHDSEFGFSTIAVTNTYRDDFMSPPPKKRVKFDEENIVVSSITYQRQQQQLKLEQLKSHTNSRSLLTKIIDYTTSLF